jgi:hypothetical protein
MDDVTGPEFETWMKQNGVKMRHVIADTGLHSNTIYAFRRGEPVNDSTRKALIDFMARWDAKKAGASAATG